MMLGAEGVAGGHLEDLIALCLVAVGSVGQVLEGESHGRARVWDVIGEDLGEVRAGWKPCRCQRCWTL